MTRKLNDFKLSTLASSCSPVPPLKVTNPPGYNHRCNVEIPKRWQESSILDRNLRALGMMC